MARYVTGDGEPHARAIARTKEAAARDAFEELAIRNAGDDLSFCSVQDLGVNIDGPVNGSAHILQITYKDADDKPEPDAELPGTESVRPWTSELRADAQAVTKDGEPIPSDATEPDVYWEVTIVDIFRH